MDRLHAPVALLVFLALSAGCGRAGFDVLASPEDSGAPDSGLLDAGPDTSPLDASDASDAGLDAGSDAAADAGSDAGSDAGCGPPHRLLAHYPFDGNADDVIGSQHGVEQGAVAYGAGRLGQAAVLNGIDSVVQLPSLVSGATSFSASFWVNTVVVAPGGPTSLWTDGVSLLDAEVCGNPVTGDWGIALVDGGHVAIFRAHSAPEINDGRWHHILLVGDAPAAEHRLYIDGEHEITIGSGGTSRTYETVPWVGVGNSPCLSSFLRGSVDDVRFYDRAFDATEVAALFACTP